MNRVLPLLLILSLIAFAPATVFAQEKAEKADDKKTEKAAEKPAEAKAGAEGAKGWWYKPDIFEVSASILAYLIPVLVVILFGLVIRLQYEINKIQEKLGEPKS